MLEDEGINLGYVIHDRDKKFPAKADTVFKSEGARVILTPLMAPLASRFEELITAVRQMGPAGADGDSSLAAEQQASATR